MDDMYEPYDDTYYIRQPKLANGSTLKIGKDENAFIMFVDQHFNWFQKKMIKKFFGIEVKDYKEG